MRSNAGMANRQGDFDFRFKQVSAPHLELWLDQDVIQAFVSSIQRSPHQEGRNNAGLPVHDALWTGYYIA